MTEGGLWAVGMIVLCLLTLLTDGPNAGRYRAEKLRRKLEKGRDDV